MTGLELDRTERAAFAQTTKDSLALSGRQFVHRANFVGHGGRLLDGLGRFSAARRFLAETEKARK